MKKFLFTLTILSLVSADASASTNCALSFGFSYRSSDSADDVKLWRDNLSHITAQKIDSLTTWQECYTKALTVVPATPFFINWTFSSVTSKNAPVHAAVEWITTPLASGIVDKGSNTANPLQGDQRSKKGQFKIIQSDSAR